MKEVEYEKAVRLKDFIKCLEIGCQHGLRVSFSVAAAAAAVYLTLHTDLCLMPLQRYFCVFRILTKVQFRCRHFRI